MSASPAIVWLRDDLRIADNPALSAAVALGGPVVVVYVLDDVSAGIRPLGGASRWWLHHSLAALGADVRGRGGRLVLRRGDAISEISALVDETGATAVYWNRRYTAARELDADLKNSLRGRGLDVQSFQANLLFEPWTVSTAEGNPYRVFTPFWRACLDQGTPRDPLPAPETAHHTRGADATTSPTGPCCRPARTGRAAFATAGRPARHPHSRRSRRSPPATWPTTTGATSRASMRPPTSARTCGSARSARSRSGTGCTASCRRRLAANRDGYLRQLVWREFNWNILFHQPELATENFRPEFDAFPWSAPEPAVLAAWQRGTTGIRLVDAGMRELWATGYMHNRVRLVAASLLVKNLLVDWRIGEQWFWDTLVDADEANNPGNWQWVAGSGADAAPYFRVFNPDLQASRFDPHGEYTARWIPDDELASAPIVDLAETRRAALAAYDVVRHTDRV